MYDVKMGPDGGNGHCQRRRMNALGPVETAEPSPTCGRSAPNTHRSRTVGKKEVEGATVGRRRRAGRHRK